MRGLKLYLFLILSLVKMSHPTWVRGLKLAIASSPNASKVAPYVGAWIETKSKKVMLSATAVAPYVGAWIETRNWDKPEIGAGVAPYVGAWIETWSSRAARCTTSVAPYVGAWIETLCMSHAAHCCRSHPTWVRGLKLIAFPWVVDNTRRTLRGCVD